MLNHKLTYTCTRAANYQQPLKGLIILIQLFLILFFKLYRAGRFIEYSFFISGKPSNMLIKENIIRSTIKGKQKAAIFIATNSLPIKEENNKISGSADGDIVYKKNEL